MCKRYIAQFDASAFFDQFSVDKQVQKFFGFQAQGKTFVQSTLPMGFRPSVDIAQSTAEVVLSFPHVGDCMSLAYVDNFVFGADNIESLRATCLRFLERCDSVGLCLNDREITIMDSFDCLGEKYCSVDQTRTLTDSTRSKLAAAHDLLKRWQQHNISCRQAAAIFGILYYASNVVDVTLESYFFALRFFRNLSAHVASWSAPAPPLTAVVTTELLSWLSKVLHAPPVPIVRPTPGPPSITIYVDASAWGWGATTTRPDGSTRCFSVPWTPSDRARYNVESSVCAEPLALERVLLAVSSSLAPRESIAVFTDHAPLVFAANSRHAKTWTYNEACRCIERVRQTFNCDISVTFVAGKSNPADWYSRGGLGQEVYGNSGFWCGGFRPPSHRTSLFPADKLFPVVRVG